MRRSGIYVAAGLLVLTGCSSGNASSGNTATSSPRATAVASGSASTPPGGQPSNSAQPPVAAESNPPGDIPDNIAFVAYTNAVGRYRFTHPEGWAEKTHADAVTFTDKLNGVQASTGTATTPPTIATAKQQGVPQLARSQAAFELRGITDVRMPAGRGVRIVYRRNSAPDAVTGRQYRDEVERYELVSGGREVVVELFGPVGADNVDAYRTMITSLRIL